MRLNLRFLLHQDTFHTSHCSQVSRFIFSTHRAALSTAIIHSGRPKYQYDGNLKIISKNFKLQGDFSNDTNKTSLAAQLLANGINRKTLQIESSGTTADGKIKKEIELDALMQRLDELDAVRIKKADYVFERNVNDVSASLKNKLPADSTISEEFDKLAADLPRTSITTAGPVKQVLELYGSPDPMVPMSTVPCHGCGARLHCRDPGIPGYLPSQKFLGAPVSELKNIPCQRCHLLKEFNIATDVTVSPGEYDTITSAIKRESALVIVLVDLTDLPNSLYRGIASLISRGRPLYIIGNKVDLLPKDGYGYLNRVKSCLADLCNGHGIHGDNIKHIALISAKTGYGIEPLISQLLSDWRLKGHVYILGCTNSGKSTLFNALLSSDFCRIAARDVISRVTTSIWPGTTLSLLKFPIVNPKPSRLYERSQRLLAAKSDEAEEETLRRKSLKATGDVKYATLMGHIGQTSPTPYVEALDSKLSKSSGYMLPSYSYENEDIGVRISTEEHTDKLAQNVGVDVLYEKLAVKTPKYDDSSFKYWCYDTPGLVNPNQIINLLSQEELGVMLMTKQIIPRTFSLRPTQVLLISGLGRIDYLKGDVFIYCTIFASHDVPVHVKMSKTEADEFYNEHIGLPMLGIPLGNAERLQDLPSLVAKEFHVQGQGYETSASDIVLSSLGWVSIAAVNGHKISLNAYTPGGLGCIMRTPALLPFAVNLRGKRIRGTATYSRRTPKF